MPFVKSQLVVWYLGISLTTLGYVHIFFHLFPLLVNLSRVFHGIQYILILIQKKLQLLILVSGVHQVKETIHRIPNYVLVSMIIVRIYRYGQIPVPINDVKFEKYTSLEHVSSIFIFSLRACVCNCSLWRVWFYLFNYELYWLSGMIQ